MYHALSPAECDALFASKYYAHLGCCEDGEPYVVPVTYLYRDGVFYCFTLEGKKIDILRRHPRVCLQVEHVEHGFAWQSAIAWGAFEQITDAAQLKELRVALGRQYGRITLHERETPVSPMLEDLRSRTKGEVDRSVIFCIRPDTVTGKAAALD